MLGASARVVGDVVHSNLIIESGAFLEGHCRHLAVATVVEDQPAVTQDGDAPSDVEVPAADSQAADSESAQPRAATAA